MASLLLSVEDLRNRLGICDDPANNDKLNGALQSTTVYLSSVLRTDFDRQSKTDLFKVDPDGEPWDGEFPMLYLSQGFIFQPSNLTVKLANTIPGLASTTAINSDARHVDPEKGLVMMLTNEDVDITVPSFSVGNRFFAQAEYTAGFETTTGEFGDVYTGIPDWLLEAAIRQSKMFFEDDSDCDEKKKPTKCCDELMCIIEGHIRFYPYATHPML